MKLQTYFCKNSKNRGFKRSLFFVLLVLVFFNPVFATDAKLTEIPLAELSNDSGLCFEYNYAKYYLAEDQSLLVLFPNSNDASSACVYNFSRMDANGVILNSLSGVDLRLISDLKQIGKDDFMAIADLSSLCESDTDLDSMSFYCSEDFAEHIYSNVIVRINGDSLSPLPSEPVDSLITNSKSGIIYGDTLYDILYGDSAQYAVFKEPRSRTSQARKWVLGAISENGIDIETLGFRFYSSEQLINIFDDSVFYQAVNNKLKLFFDTDIDPNGDIYLASKSKLYSYNLSTKEKTLVDTIKTPKKKKYRGISNIEHYGNFKVLTYTGEFDYFTNIYSPAYSFLITSEGLQELEYYPVHIIDENNYFACNLKSTLGGILELVLLTRADSNSSFNSIDVFNNTNVLGCSYNSDVISRSGDRLVIASYASNPLIDTELNDSLEYNVLIYSEN